MKTAEDADRRASAGGGFGPPLLKAVPDAIERYNAWQGFLRCRLFFIRILPRRESKNG